MNHLYNGKWKVAQRNPPTLVLCAPVEGAVCGTTPAPSAPAHQASVVCQQCPDNKSSQQHSLFTLRPRCPTCSACHDGPYFIKRINNESASAFGANQPPEALIVIFAKYLRNTGRVRPATVDGKDTAAAAEKPAACGPKTHKE